jgi:hypothetical protein
MIGKKVKTIRNGVARMYTKKPYLEAIFFMVKLLVMLICGLLAASLVGFISPN